MNKRGYQSLVVWQKSMELVESVYRLTEQFPDCEKYGLVSQMQRSAVSVPSNIAEGYGRSHKGDYLKHLSYARGSLAEVETQLIVSVRVQRIPRQTAMPVWNLAQEVGKILTTMIQRLTNQTAGYLPPSDHQP